MSWDRSKQVRESAIESVSPKESMSRIKSNLLALLIGIDHYLPNVTSDGSFYRNLKGCVRDINNVENYLRDRVGLVDDHLIKLTSREDSLLTETPPGGSHREYLPTYENMVDAFKKITGLARSGDRIYIHYSGHGARVKTKYSEIENKNGLDESLVPMDIGDPASDYLRDVEIAYLLRGMVERGLIVTLVLDSCHSGGATRSWGQAPLAVRGITTIDRTIRTRESLVATREELVSHWRRISSPIKRDLKSGAGWLPNPTGYVLLAACRAHELAIEYPFDNGAISGALTYWLLDSLWDADAGATYRTLHNRISAKVHGMFRQQNPQLEGEGDLAIFGCDNLTKPRAVNVVAIDLENDRIKLGVGSAQNMRKGVRFVLYPAEISDFKKRVSERVAIVELEKPGAAESWARIVDLYHPDKLEEGALAEMINTNVDDHKGGVRLVRKKCWGKTGLENTALQKVEKLLSGINTTWIRVSGKDRPFDFQLTVDSNGSYEILDDGGIRLSNLSPISIKDKRAPERIVQRLVHLAKYQNVKSITAPLSSHLSDQISVEIRGATEQRLPVHRSAKTRKNEEGLLTFKTDEKMVLCIRNSSKFVLNIVAFDLTPRWGVVQIFPVDRDYESCEPCQEIKIPLVAELPPGLDMGVDVVKVFVTIEPTSFRWLELSDITDVEKEASVSRSVASTLRSNIPKGQPARSDTDSPSIFDPTPASYQSNNMWTTRQLEIRIFRA